MVQFAQATNAVVAPALSIMITTTEGYSEVHAFTAQCGTYLLMLTLSCLSPRPFTSLDHLFLSPPYMACSAQIFDMQFHFLVLTVIMCATSTFGMFGGFETKKEKEIRLYLADVAVCKVECGKLAFFEPGKPCGCDASASSEEIGCCRDDYWYEYSAGYKTKITFGDRWSRRHVDELSSCLHKWGVQNETCNRMFPISDKHICNFEVNTAEFEAKFTSSTCSEGRHARGIGQSNPPLGTKNLLEDTDVRRSPLARGTTQSTSDLSVR